MFPSFPARSFFSFGSSSFSPSGGALRFPVRPGGVVRSRPSSAAVLRSRARFADDTGAATAEYAIATMAAVGFAGLLVVIMRSDEVRGILTDLVRSALTFTG